MSARRSPALSSADIDALLAPFVRAKALLIAVSGGPDSTALLLIAAEWAKRRGKPRIEAATVDHGCDRKAPTRPRPSLRSARGSASAMAFFNGEA